MKTINIVTSNSGKFLELNDILSKFSINCVQCKIDTNEIGETLEERCLSKAKDAYAKIKKPLIVDDTGLFFEAFDNWPGAYPKKVFLELGIDGIMKKLEGKNRHAYFKSIICYIDENEHRFFEGIIYGKISERIYDGGLDSLPYDKIFIPQGHIVPFCLIDDKNNISHRAIAAQNFAEWFSNHEK